MPIGVAALAVSLGVETGSMTTWVWDKWVPSSSGWAGAGNKEDRCPTGADALMGTGVAVLFPHVGPSEAASGMKPQQDSPRGAGWL